MSTIINSFIFMNYIDFFDANYKKICLKVYLLVVQMVVLSLGLALLVTYVDSIARAFHHFTPDNRITSSPLALVFYLLPALIMFGYVTFRGGAKLSSLNLPHLINVFMFVPIHFFILEFGINVVLSYLLFSFLLFSACYWGGIFMKRDLQKFRTRTLFIMIVTLVLFVLGDFLFDSTLVTFISFAIFPLLGFSFTLCEAQMMKTNILLSQNRSDFYKVVNSSVLNFICNFYVIFILFDITRVFLKSCAFQPLYNQQNNQKASN